MRKKSKPHHTPKSRPVSTSPCDIGVIWVKFGSFLGQKVSSLATEGRDIRNFLAKNKEKVLKTEDFRTFRGGDKRDRTADLLNAIG